MMWWDLIELSDNFKLIGCEWVCKTKRFPKVILNASKLDWLLKLTILTKLFYGSPVRICSRSLWHFLLISIWNCIRWIWKRDFLNWQLFEEVSMSQLEGFEVEDKEHMLYKLKKNFYGVKEFSQRFFKSNQVVTSFDFKWNVVDHCRCCKVNGSKFNIRVSYSDDICLPILTLDYSIRLSKFYPRTLKWMTLVRHLLYLA